MFRLAPIALLALALAVAACDSSSQNQPGADRAARATDTVTVDYVGSLASGTVFDEGDGVTFPLQRVIPGFRDGIVGMRVGETKTLVIPPDQAYGAAGSIPPNATLTFVVTLREIR